MLFTIHPTPRTYAEVLLSVVKQFQWQYVLAISNSSEDGFFKDVRFIIPLVYSTSNTYLQVLNNVITLVEEKNITLLKHHRDEDIVRVDLRLWYVFHFVCSQRMCKSFF